VEETMKVNEDINLVHNVTLTIGPEPSVGVVFGSDGGFSITELDN